MDERVVRVELGERAYEIRIGSGNLPSLPKLIGSLESISHAVVITDDQVLPLWGQKLADSLQQAGLRSQVLVVPAGEGSKSTSHADVLWRNMLAAGADRASVVIAVGGGVIGDLAGFVAATFTRGVRFVQVPTTLLAQVDSSVGGKVGINLPHAKNMVGAFWQPRAVLIDTEVLATLPEREYKSGLAEVIKYGVILDADFFAYLEQHQAGLISRDPAVLRHVIARSCELKAQVVQADERELTGLRAVLNYGHTFAHALEATAGYGLLLHGEAVSIGMHWAARLAHSLKRVDESFVARQRVLLEGVGLPTRFADSSREAMLDAMRHDKKTEHGKLRFILPTRLGHVELVSGVDPTLVLKAMADD